MIWYANMLCNVIANVYIIRTGTSFSLSFMGSRQSWAYLISYIISIGPTIYMVFCVMGASKFDNIYAICVDI